MVPDYKQETLDYCGTVLTGLYEYVVSWALLQRLL